MIQMLRSTAKIWKSLFICYSLIYSMHKIVLEAKDEVELNSVADILKENQIDHISWKEQPENIITAIATKPYARSCFGTLLRHLKLLR